MHIGHLPSETSTVAIVRHPRLINHAGARSHLRSPIMLTGLAAHPNDTHALQKPLHTIQLNARGYVHPSQVLSRLKVVQLDSF